MPIHVEVFLNDTDLGQLTISRLEGLTARDNDRYEYQAELYGPDEEVTQARAKFFHTRSSSVWILIAEAIVSLKENGKLPLKWEKEG